MFKASNQSLFHRALLNFFIRPTSTKSIVENDTFHEMFCAADADEEIPTIKMLSKWMNDEFLPVLRDIFSLVSTMFDG